MVGGPWGRLGDDDDLVATWVDSLLLLPPCDDCYTSIALVIEYGRASVDLRAWEGEEGT